MFITAAKLNYFRLVLMQKPFPDIRFDAVSTEPITLPVFSSNKIEAHMLRLDKIHPFVSGNKWFKLKNHLEEARNQSAAKLVTFGGAWSNHILATAAACHMAGIPCAGIIRGEESQKVSPVLNTAGSLGMELFFIPRHLYSAGTVPEALQSVNNYFVPAGGYGDAGAAGAGTILEYCENPGRFTHILCAVGTGTMMAGLQNAAGPLQKVTGISVMKNNTGLDKEVIALLKKKDDPVSIIHDYHFGGYAKFTGALIAFMNDWYLNTSIPLDFVYTGKLCFAAQDMTRKGFFPAGSRVLLIHSGGLSGNASLGNGTLIF